MQDLINNLSTYYSYNIPGFLTTLITSLGFGYITFKSLYTANKRFLLVISILR